MKKIILTESEIKNIVRKNLMEKYINEVEQMAVYKQSEFTNSMNTLKKGTYGVKDEKTGDVKSVTINEKDGDEKWIPKDLKKGRATKLTKGDKSISAIDKKLKSYDTDPEEKGVQTKNKEDLSKVRALNLAKKFKKGL